ncbi:tetratricopeptide (TPR) repeat protein [Edaphobacter lichenicola]|uniref:Tetratricopeptide (TPR) repeat protein n=1 Tax=Tunturiibacter lichenicola TaxID=2051959 RepID=A0A7W8J550_9BACT|nr:tetratricopeptide (TPR) repeat protein [Edaphobacter lichenicola]
MMRLFKWIAVIWPALVFWPVLGAAVSQQPADIESLLASAQQAQARGDFVAAAGFYRMAVTVQPDLAELHANLGLMDYQTGNHEEAIASFEQALRLNPHLFVPQFFLGLENLRLRRLQEAIVCLKQAVLIKPGDVQVQLALGKAYAALGETRLAIASFSQVAHLDSGNGEAWFHLGVAYLEQVEADARLILERHKDSVFFHALVADSYVGQREFTRAAEAYKTAIVSEALPAGVHASYGFVLLNQHDLQGAEREFNAEFKLNPGSLLARLGIAKLRVEQGLVAEAVRLITEIWEADEGFLRVNASLLSAGPPQANMVALRRAVQERIAAGETDEELLSVLIDNDADGGENAASPARAVTVDRSKLRRGNPMIDGRAAYANGHYGACSVLLGARLQVLQEKDLRVLAACSYFSGKYETAFAVGQKLALRAPTEAEGMYWETKSGQRLAAEALAHASAIDSNSPRLHILLGDVYRERWQYKEAEQEYRRALTLLPGDAGALLGLTLTLIADSELNEAQKLTEEALTTNPDDPEMNSVMGEILCDRQDFSGSEPYLKKALHNKPERLSHVHALLGRVYAETGHTQEAITELTSGIADDMDGNVHYQLGRLYLKIGDKESAKQALEVSERMKRERFARSVRVIAQEEPDSSLIKFK